MKLINTWRIILFWVILLICTGLLSTYKLKYNVIIDNNYNKVFTRLNGWTGGDCASTIPLSDSITLWLFGDSWIGPIKDNRHFNAEMINNSVAIQYGKFGANNNLNYFFKQIDNKPAPIFTLFDKRGFYWLTGGGIKTKNSLYLIASQIVKKENDSSVFGFNSLGNFIFTIDNPFDEPINWKFEVDRIPFFQNTEETQIDFGIPQFIKDGYIYIYGVEFKKKDNNRYMLLARVPEEQMLNFNNWEFYSNGNWGKDYKQADKLCNHFGAEYSVSFQPFLNKYITIYSEMGMSKNIILRTSDRPEGPWSPQEVVYETPEIHWDKDNFCYAARGHVELSEFNDLLISYVCNSTNFWKMAADARIYRPKFIRIKFEQ
jgi:Domain of unknown function (DUF4185)